jgi:hypothetical protein
MRFAALAHREPYSTAAASIAGGIARIMIGKAGVAPAAPSGITCIMIGRASGAAAASGGINTVAIGHARATSAAAAQWIRILPAIAVADAARSATMTGRIGADAGAKIGHA